MGEPTLESLRAEGADRHDPVRYRYLEVLAARLPDQPPAVQQVLAHRLQQAVTAYAERTRAAGGAASGRVGMKSPSPLAELNRDLDARAQADADQVRLEGGASASAMKSVREFSEVWARISAEQQVVKALDRGPENAGPLNPHKLMLRSISLMRDVSPDYLRRFLSAMDSLLWLEQANARPRSLGTPTKAARAGRGKN